MSTFLDDAVSWMVGAVHSRAGRTVTYRRGLSTTTLTAAGWVRDYQVFDASGTYSDLTLHDWQIVPSDLLIGGVQVEPKRGDQIEVSIGGSTRYYDVCPLGRKPCFEIVDGGENAMVIHTRAVE